MQSGAAKIVQPGCPSHRCSGTPPGVWRALLSALVRPFCEPDSPPRAWRTPSDRTAAQPDVRIASTCVDSTTGSRGSGTSPAAHLHVRGEHAYPRLVAAALHGPPPHAWRARDTAPAGRRHPRPTSTCVESTTGSSPWTTWRTAHLHVRGDHIGSHPLGRCHAGPPPRAWRAPQARLRGPFLARRTSTCVESTPARP